MKISGWVPSEGVWQQNKVTVSRSQEREKEKRKNGFSWKPSRGGGAQENPASEKNMVFKVQS